MDGSVRHPRSTHPESSDRSPTVKVRASVRKMCEGCRIIRRKGVVRVICKSDARHKQRQRTHSR